MHLQIKIFFFLLTLQKHSKPFAIFLTSHMLLKHVYAYIFIK